MGLDIYGGKWIPTYQMLARQPANSPSICRIRGKQETDHHHKPLVFSCRPGIAKPNDASAAGESPPSGSTLAHTRGFLLPVGNLQLPVSFAETVQSMRTAMPKALRSGACGSPLVRLFLGR